MIRRTLLHRTLGTVPPNADLLILRLSLSVRLMGEAAAIFDAEDLLWQAFFRFDFTAPEPRRLNLPRFVPALRCTGLQPHELDPPVLLTEARDAGLTFKTGMVEGAGETSHVDGLMQITVGLSGYILLREGGGGLRPFCGSLPCA